MIDKKYIISYKYEDILGNGAFGTVRVAYKTDEIIGESNRSINSFWSNNNRVIVNEGLRYAVKIIDKSLVDKSRTYKQLLKNELQILRESNHPKIMKVHELLEDTNFYYVVSEIIEGGSVINRMR